MSVKFKPIKHNKKYSFGNHEQLSLRSILIRIPILNQHIIHEKVDLVIADVPFSIGLEFLDRHKMHVDNVSNHFVYHSNESKNSAYP